jgi:succinate-semialdehyde dehydrogenase/glutarate-semialdehyde dehydrogenase
MGGNDAFVVLKDANLPAAVEAAYRSRMSNSGQACNAAKRFIITAPVYDKFKDLLIDKIRQTTVIGDPLDRKTNLGPMVTEE